MNDIQTKLDYADAMADWFLELAETHSLRGDLEAGLKYIYIASTILSRQNRNLSSERIESNLRFIAGRLAELNGPQFITPLKTGQKETCLHVLNEALPAGGLTAMAIRWMRNDRSRRVHNVALLSQQIPIPSGLLRAVSDTGGNVYTANPDDSFLDRAVWLKSLANNLANYIILHIGAFDVICGVAFGIKGGPPVLLVNHTAHTFWNGASIVDLVVNCRGSAIEKLWTDKHRGISRYATVPIPLLKPNSLSPKRKSSFDSKRQAKEIIGIHAESIVILTVGASFKYLPYDSLDFLEVCESILEHLPEAILLVVGFEADSRWRRKSLALGSRIRTLGAVSQSQLAIIHDAADIYIEGFPFGTTTALLEAGLKGIPIVLAPAQCPPPYGSDGVALDDTLERPRTLEEYKIRIIQLSKNSFERRFEGEKIRESITKHHTDLCWRQYLDDAIRKLPCEHSVYPSIASVRTPQAIYEYWSNFAAKWSWGCEETLEHAVTHALSIGLRPRLTKKMLQVCRDYQSIRIHRTIPLSLLVFLFNLLLPVLPIAWAHKTFRIFSFLFRGSLKSRVCTKIAQYFGKTGGPISPYEEYRHMQPRRKLFRERRSRCLRWSMDANININSH
jgi:hypothetical protein